MVKRIRALADAEADFAFETTLAAKSFAPFLRECRTKGYTINLMYFWLRSPDLAVERVAKRVASGGHSIPEANIRRRYERGLRNLFNLYLPLCDGWMVFDNSDPAPRLIAEAIMNEPPRIYSEGIWQEIHGGSNG